MSTGENNSEYTQPYESYTVDTLRDFAEELIRYNCDSTSALLGTDRAILEYECAQVTILRRQEPEGEHTYQFNIKDKTQLDTEYTYCIMSHLDKVICYYNDNSNDATRSDEYRKSIMGYLTMQDEVPVPKTSPAGKRLFEKSAATLAVQSAIEDELIDIPELAAMLNTPEGDNQLQEGITVASEYGVEIQGVPIPYSRSTERINEAIMESINSYNEAFNSPRSLETDSD